MSESQSYPSGDSTRKPALTLSNGSRSTGKPYACIGIQDLTRAPLRQLYACESVFASSGPLRYKPFHLGSVDSKALHISVYENRTCTTVDYGSYSCYKGESRTQHLISGLNPTQQERHMQSRGPVHSGHSMRRPGDSQTIRSKRSTYSPTEDTHPVSIHDLT